MAALANPIRLRIVAELAGGRDYVSHLHLQRLEEVGLIVGSLELSEDGKAMKYFEVADFSLHLTAAAIAEAAKTLTKSGPELGPTRKEHS